MGPLVGPCLPLLTPADYFWSLLVPSLVKFVPCIPYQSLLVGPCRLLLYAAVHFTHLLSFLGDYGFFPSHFSVAEQLYRQPCLSACLSQISVPNFCPRFLNDALPLLLNSGLFLLFDALFSLRSVLANCDLFWPIVGPFYPFGQFWPNKAPFAPLCPLLVAFCSFCRFWSIIILLGLFFALVCPLLTKFWHILDHFLRSDLDHFGPLFENDMPHP